MRKPSALLICITVFIYSAFYACQSPAEHSNLTTASELTPIEWSMLSDSSSFYFIDAANYDAANPELPIGVFDSGTGGLTVLDVLIQSDQFKNGQLFQNADGIPDFTTEQFIYLADQANMPYGNYYATNKSDLLVEHVLKDVQFLLGTSYYPTAHSTQVNRDKMPVKAIVIACNTATAYAVDAIRKFFKVANLNIPVIGVIDAGAKGVLETFELHESGTIGVFATVGTVASKGYERTILTMKDALGYTGDIQIVNQGGHGIAEAVDEENDYYNPTATQPRANYRGPSLDHTEYTIDKALMDVYNFDFDEGQMLCDAQNIDDCQVLQINSPENYIRYHLVSMLEKIRQNPSSPPLKAIVLGCTHYPFLKKEIEMVLAELYEYKENGAYRYRANMVEHIRLVDPSENVAQELYTYLNQNQLQNQSGALKNSQFYISVPNEDNAGVELDEFSRFTYEYKYGRNAGEIQEYVKVVPFSKENISVDTRNRIKGMIPKTFDLINSFK